MGLLIGLVAGAAVVWFLVHPASNQSATSQTPGQPTSTGAVATETADMVKPGSLDRFIGSGPMGAPTLLPPRPGVIAQLQADTTQQRLMRFYGGAYPARFQGLT